MNAPSPIRSARGYAPSANGIPRFCRNRPWLSQGMSHPGSGSAVRSEVHLEPDRLAGPGLDRVAAPLRGHQGDDPQTPAMLELRGWRAGQVRRFGVLVGDLNPQQPRGAADLD